MPAPSHALPHPSPASEAILRHYHSVSILNTFTSPKAPRTLAVSPAFTIYPIPRRKNIHLGGATLDTTYILPANLRKTSNLTVWEIVLETAAIVPRSTVNTEPIGMPANQRQKTAQSPPSALSKATAKYTNKDGSKFITVPKSSNISVSAETSPAMAQTTPKQNGQLPTSPPPATGSAPAVNKKKQKRREKQAAKLAAERTTAPQANGARSQDTTKGQIQALEQCFREQTLGEDSGDNGQFDGVGGETYYSDEDGDGYSGSYEQIGSPTNGYAHDQSQPAGKSSKKKKKSKRSQPDAPPHIHHGTNGNGLVHNHGPLSIPPLSTNMPRGPGISKEKIWNTSSQEERERIKEFWLSLGEDERKSLVKVEKDAVLKKMKEQQKHSCSCTVCGRKRTAIEEELEVLYDAYYEELEQYANHKGDGPAMPPPRRFGAIGGLQPPHRLPPAFNGPQPSRGRIVEQLEDEDDEGEEYSEDDGGEEEDEYSDEEPEELPRSHATDFFNFGNSLTVQGGILTVADDLLKNDGKKFIEMMEQLAERRMAREEDAREAYSNPNYGHPPNGAMHTHNHSHNHPPPQPDDDEYDDDEEEEEDDYDSQDEDYDEGSEMDTMTEEQRMEEGRRMFQIFAARMFEQRVLTAYKDKVAKERQQKLLEELEEESNAEKQKKAKKAKDAQKKKEKLAQKKQALAEEKLRREADKAAEEAALREAEEKKAEEQRLRAEEKRKKKEAARKAEEEERARKEAEKQRRLQEQRDRQAESERRQREAKERDRKEKEELRQREKEAREAREREAKERRERLETEKRENEAKAKSERESKEKQKREELSAQQAAAQAALAATQAKRPPIPIPAKLQTHAVGSPHVPVATPVIPKAPTPIKLRTSSSQQDSNSPVPQTPLAGGVSQNVSPIPSAPFHGSPGPIGPLGKNQNPYLHHPQATSPIHATLKSPPGMQPPVPFAVMPQIGMNFQSGMPMMAPGFGARMQHEPIFAHQPQYRPMAAPNGMPLHPPIGMPMAPGRGFPLPHGPPGFPQQIPNGLGGNEVDELSSHLGSSALLDDSDEPLNPVLGELQIRSSQSRPVAVRLMICRACKNLQGTSQDGFFDIKLVKEQVDSLNPPGEQPVSERELLDICETEGNAVNGGGSFDIREDGSRHSIRYESDTLPPNRPLGAPGEIGSPIVGGGGMSRFPGPPPGF
ncbi:stress response protein NST1 [Diplocarpon rosae]|nr:stress response protein NST1 [Diplocarpon rosae]